MTEELFFNSKCVTSQKTRCTNDDRKVTEMNAAQTSNKEPTIRSRMRTLHPQPSQQDLEKQPRNLNSAEQPLLHQTAGASEHSDQPVRGAGGSGHEASAGAAAMPPEERAHHRSPRPGPACCPVPWAQRGPTESGQLAPPPAPPGPRKEGREAA